MARPAGHEVLLRPGQVCEQLNIAHSTLLTWTAKGLIPSITLPGGQRRYRAADIDAILRGAA